MKALNMSFTSEAKKAAKSRVRNLALLKGGIGDRLLSRIDIQNIIARKAAEKEQRSWEKFIRETKQNKDPSLT